MRVSMIEVKESVEGFYYTIMGAGTVP